MKERRKKLTKKIIALICCGAFIVALCLACLGLQIAYLVCEKDVSWQPDYAMEDLTKTLAKDELDDKDYELLYRQTGLTKIGVDRMLARGEQGKDRLLNIQQDYFDEYEVVHDNLGPFTCMDFLDKKVTNVYLEDGDVIVSLLTHFASWRLGHSTIVVNGESETIIHALINGSQLDNVSYFTQTLGFMVLRVKDDVCDKETKSKVAAFAAENLLNIPYELSTGVFTDKNKINKTQCAHLIWYAYKQFGVDLDSRGKLIVTPRSLANSPNVEVVQIFGYDPVKLWKY